VDDPVALLRWGRAAPWQKRIKEVAKAPVLAGRRTNPDTMVEAIKAAPT
jgi:hypothetical protein